jgi:hypothetical protein
LAVFDRRSFFLPATGLHFRENRMLRRKWLEFVMGAAGAAIVARDRLVDLAEAAELPVPQETIPTSVAAAIKSHKASAIASFVLTYPTRANAATAQEKGTMVYLLGVCPTAGMVWETQVLATEQQRIERAALQLLKTVERSPTDMAVVLKSVGGRTVVEQKIPQMKVLELKTMAQTLIKP